MMPGFDSSQPIGEPVTVSAPGHTFGLTITRKIELTTPMTTPVIAPVVLKRRHVSASSSAGKFALAATANARPTMNETFRPEPPMIAIDDRDHADRERGDPRDEHLFVLGVLVLAHDRGPDVVR